jgi:hypothetical protein
MTEPDSARVQAFLAASVETYEELEVLLLLRGKREHEWTVDEIVAVLRLRAGTIEAACVALGDAGLLRESIESRGRAYGYAPRDAALDDAVAALARMYAEDRLAIVKMMSANAIERIRTAAMRTFAEAFVIGKDKKGG